MKNIKDIFSDMGPNNQDQSESTAIVDEVKSSFVCIYLLLLFFNLNESSYQFKKFQFNHIFIIQSE